MADLGKFKVVREQEFVGYNDRLPPEQLPRGYVADAVNCFFDSNEVKKRGGYTIIGDDLGSTAFQNIKGVRFANGTKEIIGIANGVVYKWTGSGSWSALSGSYTLATSGYIDIVVANNSAYFFDAVNTVPKYNGTTMSTVAAIPIGKFARWLHNQLHVAGITATPNRLKSSNIGDPEDFSAGAYSSLDVNPNDGDYITGLGDFNNELLVFKQNRIWSITGFGSSALTIDDLNERLTGFGTISHSSIVNTGNDVFYIGLSGDIPIIRSLKRTREGTIIDAGIMTLDIEGTMRGLNKAQLSKTVGIFDGRKVWYSLPNASSTYNNLVLTYDIVNKGWSRHTGINASCFDIFAISSTAEIYFGEASGDGKAYKFDTSTSDNGAAIAFSVKTRRFGGDSPENKKKFKWYYVSAKETGNYNLTVDYSVDGFTYGNLGTLNLSGSGSQLDMIVLDQSRLGSTDVKSERFTIPKSRNKYIQFYMYDSSATSTVVIRNWELYYKPLTPTSK